MELCQKNWNLFLITQFFKYSNLRKDNNIILFQKLTSDRTKDEFNQRFLFVNHEKLLLLLIRFLLPQLLGLFSLGDFGSPLCQLLRTLASWIDHGLLRLFTLSQINQFTLCISDSQFLLNNYILKSALLVKV